MPSLPRATITVADGQRATGYAGSADTLMVAGCCSSGTTNAPRLHSNVQALVAAFGYGPAVEAAAYVLERSGKRVLFVRMPGSTAGSNSAVDSNDATGTSVVTLTGTPYDDYEGRLLITTGGTRGTAGVVFKYSLDAGRTWSLATALGTATTYAIPNSGLTLNFAAGDFDADDEHRWTTTAPRWDSADLSDLLTALSTNNTPLVGGLLVGDLVAGDIDTIGTELDAYATDRGRFTRWFTNLRRARRTRRARGTLVLTFAEVGGSGDTITRTTGSWITDGYVNGDNVTIAGTASNDGTYTNVTVTSATVLTLDSDNDVVAEVSVTCTAEAVEAEDDWIATLASETAAKADKRESLWGGHVVLVSSVSSRKYSRPSSWAGAARFLSGDPSRALSAVADGPLVGASIVDDHGDTIEHDEAAVPGLLDARIACLRTFDGRQGVYVALPMLFAPTGSDFDRLQFGAVIDIACATAKFTLEGKLSTDVLLKPGTSTIDEGAALQIEKAVNRALANALTVKGRVTSATYTCSRDDDLSAATPVLTGTVNVQPLGYLENIATTVQFSVGA